jgi:hypothetical protein
MPNFVVENIIEDKTVVSLEQMPNGVRLVADEWYIATLSNDGILTLHSSIATGVGFQVDKLGYIKTVKE